MNRPPLLEVKDVTRVFKIGGLVFGTRLTAVENVNLTIEKERSIVLSLVGESGSGKTSLGRMILGLLKPTSGQILYEGHDISKMKGKHLDFFKQKVQPVFQNPFEAFNPLKKVDRYLHGTAINYGLAKSRDHAQKMIEESLYTVGLTYDNVAGKFPHEFSGGELQRVSIARALISTPQLLVADEPVSMIDASLRMGIINILLDLKSKYDMSIIYITHDLDTAYYISDEIAVMNRGRIVEYGDAQKILTEPLHPYTCLLLECLPEPDPEKRWRESIKFSGIETKEFEVPGCKFARRCPHAKDECLKTRPPRKEIKEGLKSRYVDCFMYT